MTDDCPAAPPGPPAWRAARSARRSRPGANRAWWDGEADDYLEEHGAFLGDARFVWGPEGLSEADVHLLGDVAGRRVLEVGAGAAQCSRWLLAAGAEPVALDLSAAMLQRGRSAGVAAGLAVPLVQGDAAALPFADRSFDLVCSAYGGVPFVDDSARGHARGGPGAATGRPLGVLGDPPAAVVLPRRPRRGRTGGAALLLGPHAVRRGGTGRGRDLRRAPPHARRPGPRDHAPPGCAWWTWSSRSGRLTTTGPGAAGARCAGGWCRAPRSSSACGTERRSPEDREGIGHCFGDRSPHDLDLLLSAEAAPHEGGEATHPAPSTISASTPRLTLLPPPSWPTGAIVMSKAPRLSCDPFGVP